MNMNKNLQTLAGIFQDPLIKPEETDNNQPQNISGEIWYQ